MKRFVFIILACITLNVYSQEFIPYYKNAVYGVFHPSDLGLGIRYDHNFKGFITYSDVSFGRYHNSEYDYINKHIKVSLGSVFELPRRLNTYEYLFMSAGLSYHYFGDISDPNHYSDWTLFPVSADIGIGLIYKKIVITIRIDPFKSESSLNIGYKIN